MKTDSTLVLALLGLAIASGYRRRPSVSGSVAGPLLHTSGTGASRVLYWEWYGSEIDHWDLGHSAEGLPGSTWTVAVQQLGNVAAISLLSFAGGTGFYRVRGVWSNDLAPASSGTMWSNVIYVNS